MEVLPACVVTRSSIPSPFRSPTTAALDTKGSAVWRGRESGSALGRRTMKVTSRRVELNPSLAEIDAVAGPISQRVGEAVKSPNAAPDLAARFRKSTYLGPA